MNIIAYDFFKLLIFFVSFVGVGVFFKGSKLTFGHFGEYFSFGVSLFIIGSGIIILLPDGIFFKVYNLLFLLIGFSFFIRRLMKDNLQFNIIFFIYLAAFLIFISGLLFEDSYQPWDDYLAYFPLARKLYETNSLFDPFFFRRVGALGGHTSLHSSFLLFFNETKFNFLELGIFRFCFALSAVEFFSKSKDSNRFIIFLIFLVFLFFDAPVLNTASYWTGSVIMLAIIIKLLNDEYNNFTKIEISLLTSALLTLRPTYIFILPIIFLIFLMKEKRIFFNLKYLLLILILITPWMISCYVSSGTIYFPFFKGYFNEDYGTFSLSESNYNYFEIVTNTISNDYIFYSLVLFLVCFIFLKHSYKHFLVFIFPLFSILINLKLPEAENPIHGIRYTFPFVICGIFISFYLLNNRDIYKFYFKRYQTIISFVIVITIFFIFSFSNIYMYYKQSINFKFLAKLYNFNGFVKVQDNIHSLQALTNFNDIIVTAIDEPFLFDFKRNIVFLFDVPGQFSPPPSLPLGSSCDNINLYLKKNKIKYILFIDPEQSSVEYSERFWVKLFQINEFQKTGLDKYHVLFSKNFAGSMPQKIPSYFANWIKPHLQFIDYLNCKKTDGYVKKIGNYYLSKIE